MRMLATATADGAATADGGLRDAFASASGSGSHGRADPGATASVQADLQERPAPDEHTQLSSPCPSSHSSRRCRRSKRRGDPERPSRLRHTTALSCTDAPCVQPVASPLRTPRPECFHYGSPESRLLSDAEDLWSRVDIPPFPVSAGAPATAPETDVFSRAGYVAEVPSCFPCICIEQSVGMTAVAPDDVARDIALPSPPHREGSAGDPSTAPARAQLRECLRTRG